MRAQAVQCIEEYTPPPFLLNEMCDLLVAFLVPFCIIVRGF